MYFAKKNGRNNFQLYSNHLSEAVKYHQNVDSLLRQAIQKNELSLVYQPLFSENKIIGVEALLRWENEELGMVPQIFLSL